MQQRRINELFALFFDPTVPWAFVVGSLAIAVAGSALYGLLSALFGQSAQVQLGLLLASLLVVVIAVFVLRQAVLFWARRTSKATLVVPEDEQAPRYGGLVLPVGLNPNGAERTILEWHVRQSTLRHCWLIASAQARDSGKVSDLRQFLLEQNVVVQIVEIDDVTRPFDSYQATLVAIGEARALRGAWPISVDITGGTATMSVGMTLAASKMGVPIQYYPSSFNRAGVPRGADAPLLVATP